MRLSRWSTPPDCRQQSNHHGVCEPQAIIFQAAYPSVPRLERKQHPFASGASAAFATSACAFAVRAGLSKPCTFYKRRRAALRQAQGERDRVIHMKLLSRREATVAIGALAAGPTFAARERIDWHALGEDVKAELRWAWANYRARAWGKGDFLPVSGGAKSCPLKRLHLVLSLIAAMDTLWVLGLDAEFADAFAFT